MSNEIAHSRSPGARRNAGTALDSLFVAPAELGATKLVDASSPALPSALVTGTPYASASLLFYDDLLADTQPDAALVLNTAFVSGIQPVALSPNLGETVSFVFLAPTLSLFLELPGVAGESSAPGHSGVHVVPELDGAALLGAALRPPRDRDRAAPTDAKSVSWSCSSRGGPPRVIVRP